MSNYFYPSQAGHIVNICPPIDLDDAAKTSDCFNMEGYSHATIIIQLGVTGAASTITLEECDDAAGTNSTAIGFNLFSETTAAGDTLGALTATASTGFATSTNDNVMYVIEIDAANLSAGYSWLRVQFTDPGAATLGSAVAILSGARYASDQSATVIA